MANIKNGMSGDEVKDLQQKLINAGYDVGSTGADGKFGKNTQAAVEAYQRDHGLAVDGIAGVNTMGSLNASSSGSSSGSSVPEAVTQDLHFPTPGAVGDLEPGDFGYSSSKSSVKKEYAPSQDVIDALDELNNYGTEYGGSFSLSDRTKGYQNSLKDAEQKLASIGAYEESDAVKRYREMVEGLEGQKIDPYQSQYKGQIDSILADILNQKDFDINNDANYKQMYDQYAQMYQANASRAMRDSIANAAGMTGGYGNTYGQMVGQQAYDQTMEGLNNQNLVLMDMARAMYDADRADKYNQLNSVRGLEESDYSRYRDQVSDLAREKEYAANRYDTERGLDYGRYRDTVADAEDLRDYYASMADNERNFDYQTYRDEVGDFYNNRNFLLDKYGTLFSQDYAAQTGDRDFEYNANRAGVSDYNTAFDDAYALARAGIPVSERNASVLNPDDVETLNSIANQMVQPTSGGSGGSGSGGSGGSGGGSGDKVIRLSNNGSYTEDSTGVKKFSTLKDNLKHSGAKYDSEDPNLWSRNAEDYEVVDMYLNDNDLNSALDALKSMDKNAAYYYIVSRGL